jgi:hypothetical protein
MAQTFPAVPGVTTAAPLQNGVSTQIAGSNNGRGYALLVNTDTANTVYLAFGTNNNATINHIPIPPGSYYERDNSVPKGDVAVFAPSGMPVVCWQEV